MQSQKKIKKGGNPNLIDCNAINSNLIDCNAKQIKKGGNSNLIENAITKKKREVTPI